MLDGLATSVLGSVSGGQRRMVDNNWLSTEFVTTVHEILDRLRSGFVKYILAAGKVSQPCDAVFIVKVHFPCFEGQKEERTLCRRKRNMAA